MYFKYIIIFLYMLFYLLVSNATLTTEELADFYNKVTLKDKKNRQRLADCYKQPFIRGSFTLTTVRKYLDEDKPNLDGEDVHNIILRMGLCFFTRFLRSTYTITLKFSHHMSLKAFQSAMNQRFTDGELNAIYDVIKRRETIVEKKRCRTSVTKKVTKDGARKYFNKELHNHGLAARQVEGIIAPLRDKHMTRKKFKKLMRSQDNYYVEIMIE
ncbi:uncharacterized protein LOC126836772 isoform X1 [Adelges cooleyi]|uniref:uncharacterized protein LOC126836772 isoform X1 n=1 Tax=Adelges cooleyi TaxID=133065 RepID=UPI00217FA44E|nr:uncharacterized protein LOC126836772 isoform X1 [Adelges cooleyi]